MKKIVVLGLVCLLAGAAHAVLIAWDNFDYETGSLGGQQRRRRLDGRMERKQLCGGFPARHALVL